MKHFTMMVGVLFVFIGRSQAQDADTSSIGWNHRLVSGITLTQVSFSDWSQGGENALAYTATLEGRSTLQFPKMTWSTTHRFAFGQTRLGSQSLRKTDDKIDLESALSYIMGVHLNPYAAVSLKTQFSTGFKFDNTGAKTAVSRFFDPAYLTQSAGIIFQPIPEFRTRVGAAVREIVTSEFTSYADNKKTPTIEKVDVAGGIESVSEIEWRIDKEILFTSKIELFAPFNALKEVVLRSDNTITARAGSIVTAMLNLQMIHEKTVSPRTQIKQSVSLGVAFSLL